MSDSSSSLRKTALLNLVQLRRPVHEAREALQDFPWDDETELVKLTTQDLSRILDQYLSRRITNAECEQWAEAIEGRDDIGLDPQHRDLIAEFLFAVSSPEIDGPLSDEVAQSWKRRLLAASRQ